MKDSEQAGADAYAALIVSRSLMSACDPATVMPRDAMRLFLPPVPEDMIQIARPLPEPFAAWCRGFAAARERDKGCKT